MGFNSGFQGLIAHIDNNSEESSFINCGQAEWWAVVGGNGTVRQTGCCLTAKQAAAVV